MVVGDKQIGHINNANDQVDWSPYFDVDASTSQTDHQQVLSPTSISQERIAIWKVTRMIWHKQFSSSFVNSPLHCKIGHYLDIR